MLDESERLLLKLEKECLLTKRTTFDSSFYADFSSNALQELESMGYIKRTFDITGSIKLTHSIVMPVDSIVRSISGPGNRMLYELEADSEKDRNDRSRKNAEKKEQDAESSIDKRKAFIRDIAVAVIGSTVAGLTVLAVQDWTAVSSFIANIFHQITS